MLAQAILPLGLALRAATMDDIPFLRALYGGSREEELRPVPWSERDKQGFLDSQFALQHRHFVTQFNEGYFLIVEREGQPRGRFYLDDNEQDDAHIVDIALLPAERGRGVGRALIRATQDRAACTGRGVGLYVEKHNTAAQRLYARLGFRLEGEEAFHYRLRWTVS